MDVLANKTSVLCIGRTYCDLIFTGAGEMPVLGKEVFAEELAIRPGGGGFITAAHLQQIGQPAALLSRLGFDSISESIGMIIRKSGINLDFVEWADDAGPQVTAACVLGEERAFLTRRAGHSRPETLEEALQWYKATHLHIAEYATLLDIPDLVDIARYNGLTISLDPSWDGDLIYGTDLLEKSRGVDIFFPNLEEGKALTGSCDPEEILAKLNEYFPVVVLKCGAQGAWVSCNGKVSYQKAPTVSVVDTTGAGDAFNAGFLKEWLSHRSIEKCLINGIKVGSASVQYRGGIALIK